MIEIAALGPAPFGGMLLADMGAEVILVERKNSQYQAKVPDTTRRGKKSITLDLKDATDQATLLQMVKEVDVLFEGFRPGVMERLGLGPEECLAANPKLIYARMTGWGQYGPLAKSAGHDINYISLTGPLAAMGTPRHPPAIPLNLVGDYGGGAMFLVVGILAAYIEAQTSGKGQVVDAAMTDGTANLMAVFNTLHALGMHKPVRGKNMLDAGAHYYNVYETSDEKYVSIGPLEPQFYALLIEKMGLDPAFFARQHNQRLWPEMKEKLAEIFKQKSQAEWCALLEGTDVCFAPVLNYLEAQSHPHLVARDTYFELDGIMQPSPAPRFSRTPSEVQHGSPVAGEHSEEIRERFEL